MYKAVRDSKARGMVVSKHIRKLLEDYEKNND